MGAENFVEQYKPRRIRPRRRDRTAKRGIAAANQAGAGIAQHRSQFSRSLTSVHWNGNKPLRDNREIERRPPDTVRSEQRATVSSRKSRSAQKGSCGGDLTEKVRSRRGSVATRICFSQNNAAGAFLQFR